MSDAHPWANEKQTELARFRFPYRELIVEEYAARFGHTIDRTSFFPYTQCRYQDHDLDFWIEKLYELLHSPFELNRLRREHLGTSDIEFRLLSISLCNESTGLLKWHSKQCDTVRASQTLLEIETKKAVFDLPCPRTGIVKWRCPDESEIHLGQPLIIIEPSEADHELANPQSGEAWWCPTNGTHTCEGWPHLRELMKWSKIAKP